MKLKKPRDTKAKLHPRNRHRGLYDFDELLKSCPELAKYLIKNPRGEKTINFFDPQAVKYLNLALLRAYYRIEYWDLPPTYLCPPIPGRADYIHYVADILASTKNDIIPTRKKITCLDIGVGANCIYPIIGIVEYDWNFIGVDIDQTAIASAAEIIQNNTVLNNKIELRKQNIPDNIFQGVIDQNDRIDISICNPPFHASRAESEKATKRKLKNLKGGKQAKTIRNFSGNHQELWYPGGERAFISKMIDEGTSYSGQIKWFTCLVSKESNLQYLNRKLNKIEVRKLKTIEMNQGNKKSRILAWQY